VGFAESLSILRRRVYAWAPSILRSDSLLLARRPILRKITEVRRDPYSRFPNTNKPWMPTPTSPFVLDVLLQFQHQPRDQHWLSLAGLASHLTFAFGMKSYRFTLDLIAAVQKTWQRASSVIRVGGFRALRSSLPFTFPSPGSSVIPVGGFRVFLGLQRFRLAGSGSTVTRVGDSGLILRFGSSCLPDPDHPDSHGLVIRPASCRPYQIPRTRRVMQPLPAALFSMFPRNSNSNPAINAHPRW
jgi:hypothetical protein